ncbi:aconitate hydratase 1 [Xanthomonas oryzae pv. oryzae PXO99A]|uniref:Aconitate hydratase 1 n=1 Tax=Xanthomonas oryzae pv. oryzae (strain PXO99A) TaxID=360094 RepID=A0A0K0GPQ9_XANOP|nr:aconitate hydratase 1 [Xanthomonas oryzae pv. oryzae PXO99A]
MDLASQISDSTTCRPLKRYFDSRFPIPRARFDIASHE